MTENTASLAKLLVDLPILAQRVAHRFGMGQSWAVTSAAPSTDLATENTSTSAQHRRGGRRLELEEVHLENIVVGAPSTEGCPLGSQRPNCLLDQQGKRSAHDEVCTYALGSSKYHNAVPTPEPRIMSTVTPQYLMESVGNIKAVLGSSRPTRPDEGPRVGG
jgi:hypothetical protein